MEKELKIFLVVFASFFVSGLILLGVLLFIKGDRKDNRVTLVEDLADNKLSPGAVKSVSFFRERPGFMVGPEIHTVDTKEGVEELMTDLANSLKKEIHRGYIYHNHASSLIPKQKMEIVLKDGSIYSLYGHISHNWDGEDYYFFDLHVWPKDPPPGKSQKSFWQELVDNGPPVNYESRGFVEFLKKHSPFLPNDLEIEKPITKKTLKKYAEGKLFREEE